LISKMVDYDYISIELVLNVGDERLPWRDRDIFEITYAVIGHVSEKGTVYVLGMNLRVRLERIPEVLEQIGHLSFMVDGFLGCGAVGIARMGNVLSDYERGDRITTDEG